MRWDDNLPRKAIRFGSSCDVPEDDTLFRVCVLRVPVADPLPAAYVEFWQRVLTEGVGGCSDRWTVLLFQMNLLGGGFTCVFTDGGLVTDESPVFKFSSEALEAACYDLPEREPGDPRAEEDSRGLESQCLGLLLQAACSEPISGLLARLRTRRHFAVLACDFYRTRTWPVGL